MSSGSKASNRGPKSVPALLINRISKGPAKFYEIQNPAQADGFVWARSINPSIISDLEGAFQREKVRLVLGFPFGPSPDGRKTGTVLEVHSFVEESL